jgi:hypothetical protein
MDIKSSVKQPVKAIDPTTSYYGKLKLVNPVMANTVTKGYANMHANLLNEGDDHLDTQGNTNKIDRLKAMARRMGKVY